VSEDVDAWWLSLCRLGRRKEDKAEDQRQALVLVKLSRVIVRDVTRLSREEGIVVLVNLGGIHDNRTDWRQAVSLAEQ